MRTKDIAQMDRRSLTGAGALSALLALYVMPGGQAFSEDESAPPKNIPPAQARQHLGQRCVATFIAEKTKLAVKRNGYYIDSQEDFHDPKNPVKISRSRQIDDLAAFLKGKTIRVTGAVFLQDDLSYIKVTNPADLVVVETKTQG